MAFQDDRSENVAQELAAAHSSVDAITRTASRRQGLFWEASSANMIEVAVRAFVDIWSC